MGYEIDRDALSKLRNLDDETMSNIIRKIAAASGMNDKQAESLSKNTGFIKRKLATMNPSKVSRMIASADESAISEIMKSIKSDKGGNNFGK